MPHTVHKTCNLCEATCGLLIDVEDNRVLEIRADDDDPFSRGHICPKAFTLKEVQEDPDRLRHPVRRTANGWEEISWEEALEETATRFAEIQKRYGKDTVASYIGNPTAHNFGCILGGQMFLQALGTRNKYSASSVDQNPRHAASLLLYGHIAALPIPDINRTQYLLILGANPVTSNGSIMTAPDIRNRLRAIKKRNGKIVVIDPRFTETARMADEHFFIRPGNDALLLAALLNTVFEEGLTRKGPAHDLVTGIDSLRRQVAAFTPEAVAPALGIEAGDIRRIAREFAEAPTAVCYARIGTCLHPFGTLSTFLVDALNIVTGNFDRAGGAMFTHPAVDLIGLATRMGQKGHMGVWKSRVRGVPEFNGELPAAVIAEEMLTPGEGQIRGLVTIAGNPVLSTPNGRQLDKALEGLEFYAAVDFYINETTRHADIILPPVWSLEKDNYEIAFHLVAVHNTSKYSPQVLRPPANTKNDWEILIDLTLRLLQKKAANPVRGGLMALARRLQGAFTPRLMLDTLLRTGPHGDGYRPWKKGLSLKALEKSPKGVDLGPLTPGIRRILQTESMKVPLDQPIMREEIARLEGFLKETAVAAPQADGLLLIGRRDLRTNNSWSHNSLSLVKGGPRCDLLMNPKDAERLSLSKGDRVRVKSRVGEVVTTLGVTDEIMPGVVSLPHGWGHNREGIRLEIAREAAGVSVNDLTDDKLLEPVVGNAVLNGVPVTVGLAKA